ncbi:MAG TPA: molybdopterin dinucleotide binding domain-containing protein, partial [Gemmatales bacterium]|nr:molybdopterin dinucleotide binding domain-containing protein [Gemmatales bacterium]
RVLAPCPVDWKKLESHQAIRELIADLIPGLEELKTIDAKKKEFHIPGRILHQPVFPTSTGKAYFHVTPLPQQDVPEGHLRLMTIRSEGQFNTVVYEEEDLYRHQERRDIILLHKTDMEQHGISDNERITIRSSTGVMHNILARSFDIHPGNAAMYFPEANVLVPRGVDPHSRTPAFKSVLIQLEPERQGLTQAEDLIRKLQKRPFHE